MPIWRAATHFLSWGRRWQWQCCSSLDPFRLPAAALISKVRTRAASMDTRPWVTSASRQRLTSWTGRTEPSARASRFAGSNRSGKGSLMPGSVLASACRSVCGSVYRTTRRGGCKSTHAVACCLTLLNTCVRGGDFSASAVVATIFSRYKIFQFKNCHKSPRCMPTRPAKSESRSSSEATMPRVASGSQLIGTTSCVAIQAAAEARAGCHV